MLCGDQYNVAAPAHPGSTRYMVGNMIYATLWKLTPVLFLVSVLGTSLPASSSDLEQKQALEANQKTSIGYNGSTSEKQEIEQHIKRIEEKLKTEPKVEGWVLVGDAYMHLERYSEAVKAYQNAYLLSEDSSDVRAKLKRALYHAGLEASGGDHQANP